MNMMQMRTRYRCEGKELAAADRLGLHHAEVGMVRVEMKGNFGRDGGYPGGKRINFLDP
jgi:hypothetical protein